MPDTTARQKLLHRYMWLVVTVGSTIFLYSAQNLPYQQLDFRFLLLFLLTAVISSRIAIRIPRANTTITVADTFVFLTLLLYGPEAAVVVATIDGLSSGLHLSRRWITVLFNAGASASAVFTTGALARLLFGTEFNIHSQPFSSSLVILCVVAVAQYLMHTWLVAICLGLKTDRPLWQTWTKHYLWSSLTYFVGAFLAGGIVKLENTISFYAVLQQRSFSERDLIISVNLSAKQLMEHDLVQRIAEVLQETQLKPWHLKLEVTESVVMENPEIAAITLGKLRALGVLLSIDDFGTGYSSLSYLNRFPLDILKIDRSFISTMNQNDENLQIVKTIVTLAGNLGMEVIAEGVETEEQLNQLRLLRCQYAQGFLFSQPMNAMDADLFILNRVNSPAALPIPEAPGFVM
jgi:EAL domain-containing protein (putative c-di-GMP-specific phosphodiesterase class I)/uncharacterized membrane protein